MKGHVSLNEITFIGPLCVFEHVKEKKKGRGGIKLRSNGIHTQIDERLPISRYISRLRLCSIGMCVHACVITYHAVATIHSAEVVYTYAR